MGYKKRRKVKITPIGLSKHRMKLLSIKNYKSLIWGWRRAGVPVWTCGEPLLHSTLNLPPPSTTDPLGLLGDKEKQPTRVQDLNLRSVFPKEAAPSCERMKKETYTIVTHTIILTHKCTFPQFKVEHIHET